jgi:hypothetical protein
MLSVLADGSKLTPFVILKTKDVLKGKLPSRIMIKSGCLKELAVKWLSLGQNNTGCSCKEKNAGFR